MVGAAGCSRAAPRSRFSHGCLAHRGRVHSVGPDLARDGRYHHDYSDRGRDTVSHADGGRDESKDGAFADKYMEN